MKHGRKLTVKMKEFLQERGIKAKQYLQVKNMPNELHFVHIKSGRIRIFIKREDGNWYESNRNCKTS